MEDFRKRATANASKVEGEPTENVIRAMEHHHQELERQVALYRAVLKSLSVKRVDDPESREKLIEDVKELAKQLASREEQREQMLRELSDSHSETARLLEENHRLIEQLQDRDRARDNAPSKDRGLEFDR